MSLLAAALLGACAPASTWPALQRADLSLPGEAGQSAKIVLIGDSGYFTPEGDATHIGPDQRVAMMRSIRQEGADLILALGDLVYPQMRLCDPDAPGDRYLRHMDARVGAYLGGMGAPVALVIGNHEGNRLSHLMQIRSPRRERCLQAYAERDSRWSEPLHFPDTAYTVDLGPAHVTVVNTNELPGAEESAGIVAGMDAARERGAWALMAGHHVWKTHGDKDNEDRLRPWAEAEGAAPDLYANGHAHALQLGVYAGVPAVTSGTGAKLRDTPECSPQAPEGCADGQRFGHAGFGYALVEAGPETLQVRFKTPEGQDLPGGCWQRTRGDAEGSGC